MKKLVLFGVCSMFAASALAGGNGMRKVRAAAPPEMEGRPTGPIQSIDPSIYSIGPGDSLGFTVSDYGSNGSVYHNLINFGDGKFSLGRQTSEIGAPSFTR